MHEQRHAYSRMTTTSRHLFLVGYWKPCMVSAFCLYYVFYATLTVIYDDKSTGRAFRSTLNKLIELNSQADTFTSRYRILSHEVGLCYVSVVQGSVWVCVLIEWCKA